MKRITLTLILGALATNLAFAQSDQIAQPTHVIGKRINEAGEVTMTLVADFSYHDNGKPNRFDFPAYVLWSTYAFGNDLLTREYTNHGGGEHDFGESYNYNYEDGKLMTASHIWSDMNTNEYWQYEYYEDGRLKRTDYRDGYEPAHQHYLYEYENEGKTKIECYWTSWASQGLKLRKRTTSQYDDDYRLLSALVENFSVEGELTSSSLTSYTYSPTGKQLSKTTQTLTDGEWVNSNIVTFTYDESDRVVEQQSGPWQPSTGEWNINRRITFELSNGGQTYTVSAYQKSGDNWVWGVLGTQTLFFEPYLKIQQKSMRHFAYEDMFGSGMINQFEITMEFTKTPNYWETADNQEGHFSVFPNPGNSSVTVKAPVENAVVYFYDLQGRRLTVKPFDFQTNISADDWAPGIYLWEIWEGPAKAAYGKWVKE